MKLIVRSRLEALLVVLGVGLVLLLVGEEIPRILFPWDLRYFPESPFLTDMMKLSAGQGFYTMPSDGNSYIYAPGLGWLTYAVLRPFHAQLDIRACRAVTIAIGFVSAAVAGSIAHRFFALLGDRPASRAARALATCAAALVVFINYTADACHPDNLYALHAMALVALTFAAVATGSFRRALAAVAFAALAVAVKQTAALGLVGSAAVLLYFHARAWGWVRAASLVASGLAVTGVSAYACYGGWGRVWALDAVAKQAVELERAPYLLAHFVAEPHRLFLALTFLPSAFYVFLKGGPRVRRLWAVWLAVGVTEVWPSLLSYFKVFGYWNNLVIIDLWASLPVVGLLLHGFHAAREKGSVELRAACGGALGIFLVSLVPTRAGPTDGQRAFGRALDDAVSKDLREGKRVLVSHGASTLVHAGALEPPLDRALSLSELHFGEEPTGPAAASARFSEKRYDRVYVFFPYVPEVQASLDASYHEVGQIPGDGWHATAERLGVQSFMSLGVRILEPNR